MEITPLLERNVTTLSGGEQQRVAFARAILSAPRLLLLDEPMSSLDSRLKKRLIPFLLRIRDEFRIPLIYVTHDAGELVALCDEVLCWSGDGSLGAAPRRCAGLGQIRRVGFINVSTLDRPPKRLTASSTRRQADSTVSCFLRSS